MPPSAEASGWSRLIAGTADRVLLRTVRDMHRNISDGAYRFIGPIGAPVKRVTDTVTDGVYDAIGASLRAAGWAGAYAAQRLGDEHATASPAAVKARAMANGAIDRSLLALAPELELELTVRQGGEDIELDAAGLANAFPAASDEVAVFVHGLMDTDAVWAARAPDDVELPELAVAAGLTPVFVRYGTGRAIGRNGTDLAATLQSLVTAWPVPVTRLVLVGHSMGGLLARSAALTAAQHDHAWPQLLTDVVYLGSPHLGSWLEKSTNVGTWALRTASSRSAPIGELLDARSQGIKDLRFGTLPEDGWTDTAVDGLLTGRVPDAPWIDGTVHHLIVGRLRADPRHPLNTVFGDSLVRDASASAQGRWRRIVDGGEVVIVRLATGHNALVRAPEVAEVVREVLQRG